MFPKRLMLCVETPDTLEMCRDEIAWLSIRLGCSLVIYHAIRPYRLELASYKEWKLEQAAAIRELAREGELALLSPEIECESEPNDLVESIVSACRRHEADLVVVPTHARRGLDRLVYGSVAERLTRSCRVPVLTFDLERVSKEKEVGFDHVIAPTDFSEAANLALGHALDLAERMNVSATALHVMEMHDIAWSFGERFNPSGDIHGELVPRVMEQLEQAVGRASTGDVGVKRHAVFGLFVEEVRTEAKTHGNPLLVAATSGRDSLGDHVLGSRTERLVRRAGCSVLVLPGGETDIREASSSEEAAAS